MGFEKVWLKPGQKQRVRVVIDPAATNHPLGVWDSGAQAWTVAYGDYVVQVNASAATAALSGTIRLHR